MCIRVAATKRNSPLLDIVVLVNSDLADTVGVEHISSNQLREAFPFEQVPKYRLRDRDRIFGADFPKQVEELSIEEVLSAQTIFRRVFIDTAARCQKMPS